MNTISRLWSAFASLAGALERLTGLVHQAADQVEARVSLPSDPEPVALPNGHAEPVGGRRRR